ncbi:hypothetical protein G6O69_25855 [Pseudenhygromyxa sp. WMMC2535]|uniref:YncE family protein n=1 Tax=Pseudenhygromyxa sp. WMMC2535 TaxID=2712867 RepID=UPI0015548D35|nr:hypothetical protein [Pseudenhygromyxa sp. WMMC2535]NVB41291.1 hypothetical protein [Pseudenhygromyxa sp. WMMC2535]
MTSLEGKPPRWSSTLCSVALAGALDRPRPPSSALITSLLAGFGALLGLLAFSTSLPWPIVAAPALAIGLAHALLHHPRLSPRLRVLAGLVWAMGLGLVLTMTALYGLVLSWAALPWLAALALLGLGLSFASAAPRWRYPQLPLSLPLGAWTLACLLGWQREEARVRCDDRERLLAQDGVQLLIPTRPDLASCAPGRALAIDRYPRKVWEHPLAGEYLITTQRGPSSSAQAEPTHFAGAVCRAPTDGSSPPRCLSAGKGYNIVDLPAHDALLVAGGERHHVVAYTRTGALRVLAAAEVRNAVNVFHDPARARLAVYTDEGGLHPLEAASLAPPTSEVALDSPAIPERLLYRPASERGLLCFASGPLFRLDGTPYMAMAFTPEPYTERPLGADSWLAPLALSWGCDWDEARGRVYAGLATLGLLATLDYDSGALEDLHYIGPGARAVVYDPARDRIYVANFLRGELLALTPEGERERRWFIGHFTRDLQLTRDGRALLATSNLGLVRVELDP